MEYCVKRCVCGGDGEDRGKWYRLRLKSCRSGLQFLSSNTSAAKANRVYAGQCYISLLWREWSGELRMTAVIYTLEASMTITQGKSTLYHSGSKQKSRIHSKYLKMRKGKSRAHRWGNLETNQILSQVWEKCQPIWAKSWLFSSVFNLIPGTGYSFKGNDEKLNRSWWRDTPWINNVRKPPDTPRLQGWREEGILAESKAATWWKWGTTLGQFRRNWSQGEDEALIGDVLSKVRGLSVSPTVTPLSSHWQNPAGRQLTQQPGEFRLQESATFNGRQRNERTNRPGTGVYALKTEPRITVID